MPPSTYDESLLALDHVDHVEHEIHTLSGAARSTAGLIADRHREIGQTFKRAEILATLAVSDALDRLTSAIATIPDEARGPSTATSHSRRIYDRAADRGQA